MVLRGRIVGRDGLVRSCETVVDGCGRGGSRGRSTVAAGTVDDSGSGGCGVRRSRTVDVRRREGRLELDALREGLVDGRVRAERVPTLGEEGTPGLDFRQGGLFSSLEEGGGSGDVPRHGCGQRPLVEANAPRDGGGGRRWRRGRLLV